MPFTTKTLTEKIDLPENEAADHRKRIGLALRDSFFTIRKTLAQKIDEDGLRVYQYPDDYLEQAEKVFGRYRRKHNVPMKQKRKRILKPLASCGTNLNG